MLEYLRVLFISIIYNSLHLRGISILNSPVSPLYEI